MLTELLEDALHAAPTTARSLWTKRCCVSPYSLWELPGGLL